jgi:VIT1/CCC1 family predicted Fe2+/Mn2+ transporter
MPKKEGNNGSSAIIRDIILGGQDGLVNVLGVVLAIATATHSKYIILISGLAATFAESISMAAVAYTSAKAGKEFYVKRHARISEEFSYPVRDAFVVGVAAIVGSLIPLIPFFFIPVQEAFWATLGFSTLVLFASGAVKAKYTGTNPFKSAVEMAVVGMTAAIAGYLIGAALGALPLV